MKSGLEECLLSALTAIFVVVRWSGKVVVEVKWQECEARE